MNEAATLMREQDDGNGKDGTISARTVNSTRVEGTRLTGESVHASMLEIKMQRLSRVVWAAHISLKAPDINIDTDGSKLQKSEEAKNSPQTIHILRDFDEKLHTAQDSSQKMIDRKL